MHVAASKVFISIVISIVGICLALPTLWHPMNSLIPGIKLPKVSLGLDLQGGTSMLLEIEEEPYLLDYLQRYLDSIKVTLQEKRISFKALTIDNNKIVVVSAAGKIDELSAALRTVMGRDFDYFIDGDRVVATITSKILAQIEHDLVNRSIEIIRRRVDEGGTKEIDIQRQGGKQILLQVPGVSDQGEMRKLLGKTARMSFHLVDADVTFGNLFKNKQRVGLKILPMANGYGGKQQYIAIKADPILTGDMLVDAKVNFHLDSPVVSFKLNSFGGKVFADVSSRNIGQQIAIILDNVVISAPVIREPILGGSSIISGNFSIQSAGELALLLRAGALPTPLNIVEERVVGPSLGADSIKAGTQAVIIGACLVVLMMLIFYGIFGLVANIALLLNLLLMLGCMAVFEVTLTLPGIAGIALTLGMAVDANVLICERIREELRNGRSNLYAIESGYKVAFATILDANITTIIVTLILYACGTGPVQGFALSLTIGIVCSMFTAVFVTKIITAGWVTLFKPRRLYL